MSELTLPSLSDSSPAARPAASSCGLCGLPLGRFAVRQAVAGKERNFCCPGCSQVFLLLFNSPGGVPADFRQTDLYRACLEAGIIPRGNGQEWNPGAPAQEENSLPPLDVELKVEGMWCPSCSWLIEEVVRRTRGVLEARVSFISDRVQVKYAPHLVSPDEIRGRISRLGFRPALAGEVPSTSPESRERVLRLGISAILTANVMMISMALYFGFFQHLSPKVIGHFSYPIWLLATPVVFYGGLPILRRGWAGLRYGAPSMDTLVALGALAAYGYSVVQVARGSIHLYFETAAMLITFVLLGKYMETHAREKVLSGIFDLCQLVRRKVRLWSPPEAGEKERWVSSEEVSPGEEFLVCAGERIPLDGRVVSGRGEVDESILTGEARPTKKTEGGQVYAGSLLAEGRLRVKTTSVGAQSSIGQMVALMQGALAGKDPAEVMADQVTRWFVPGIVLLAALTFSFLFARGAGLENSLLRALTVLLISCPCALGIATPIVKLVVVGMARSRGLLIRDPAALERTRKLDILVFDKTGTLTEGDFSLRKVCPLSSSEEEILARGAALEGASDHYLARAIIGRARQMSLELPPAGEIEPLEGMGVKGRVKDDLVSLGSRRLMERDGLSLSPALDEEARRLEEKGMTVVFIGWAGEVKGSLAFGDSLKDGVQEMISSLAGRGITSWIISGDGLGTTRAVARESGVRNFRAPSLPAEKVQLIKSLQAEGHRVGMVGDGINDGPALAQSDVGFALGAGTQILRQASDFTFLSADPARVLQALSLSSLAVRAVRQNLCFAFFYNAVTIPLARGGWLNPLMAVLAMFASSLTVTGNALRISRIRV